MANVEMQFKKGDRKVHYFELAEADYIAGGTLYFTAKPAIDNDATDAAAVINKSFDDSVVEIANGYARWTLEFLPDDITGVSFANGEKKKKYLGEFHYVNGDNQPSTFPSDDEYIDVIIYADIKRASS